MTIGDISARIYNNSYTKGCKDTLYLAYTDESGDSGYINSPTKYIVICCILVNEKKWHVTLENIINLRQKLKEKHGIPVRSELKAEHLVYGRGPLKGLQISRRGRIAIYESLLDFESNNLDIQTFAIAIAKDRIKSQSVNDPRARAWAFLMQRLETFCEKCDPPERAMLLPDEGHGQMVQRIMRKMRRYQVVKGLYGGRLDITAKCLVEDPVHKNSSESYFIQVADWNAYAAHKYKEIAPNTRVKDDLWDRLGRIRLLDVNEQTGGPPGIVVWPR